MNGRDRLNDLTDDFKAKALVFLNELDKAGITVCITSGRRTISQQNVLYAQGRTAKGSVVTNAKGGQSPHNFGMAIDVCPMKGGDLDWNAPDKVWRQIADIGKQSGLVPGYFFRSIVDKPHIEDPNWKQVQLAWRNGDIKVS